MQHQNESHHLRIKIASLLGISYEIRKDTNYDEYGPVWWIIVKGVETYTPVFYISGSIEPSKEYIWLRIFMSSSIPDWPSDTDSAFKLIENASFELRRYNTSPDDYICTIFDGPMLALKSRENGNTPSIAICKAWIAWKES